MNAVPGPKSVFYFYITPEFTMLAFTTALETLRLANQVLGRDKYAWRIVSADGKPVRASSGLQHRAAAGCSPVGRACDPLLVRRSDPESAYDQNHQIHVQNGHVVSGRHASLQRWLGAEIAMAPRKQKRAADAGGQLGRR